MRPVRRRGAVRAGVAAVLVLVLWAAGPAAASTSDVRVGGTAVSELPTDLRILSLNASSSGGARGNVYFRHDSPQGISRFTATVSCLQVDGEGTVRFSGRVERGRTAGGVVLDGRDVAFTVRTGSSPQRFSLPRFGPPGTLVPCSGGRPDMVDVTRGGIHLS